MSDEFTRIDQILRRLQGDANGANASLEVENGDDAAVLRIAGATVLSVDAAVEGTHFQRDWLSFHELGYRGLVAALSDLAAMGANAHATLTSLISPADLTDADVYAIADGCAEAARQYRAPVIGGNLSRGTELSLTTTVIGSVNSSALRRNGAKPGDLIYVTGVLGTAALGLRCLQQHRRDPHALPFISHWKRPVARIADGLAVRPLAHAAIDVSDGLVQDLSHLCRASSVSATLHVECLPLAQDSQRLAESLGHDAIDLALTGGEDYELLFTAPGDVALPCAATLIGEIETGRGVRLVEHGVEREFTSARGFRHFE